MPPPLLPTSTIREADCAQDGSGGVYSGGELTQALAIVRRQNGRDVVVCGQETFVNARLAFAIESAVGPCKPDGPHLSVAGAQALPHFQQKAPPPEGHTFYETPLRKAVPKP